MPTPFLSTRRQWLTQLGALGLATPVGWAWAPSAQAATARTDLDRAVQRAARRAVAGGRGWPASCDLSGVSKRLQKSPR